MKGIESGGGKAKPKKVSPPKGKGPLAPKPQGVFASPVKAPSVKAKPKPVAKRPSVRPARTVSALDVLPAKKGGRAKPYQPAPAAKVVQKVRVAKAKAQHEAKDTKGDTERAQVDAYKQTPAYLAALKIAADNRQQAQGEGPGLHIDLASRNTKFVPVESQKDRPRSDAELRKFLVTGVRPVRRGTAENGKIENQVLPVQLLRRTVDDYVNAEANAIPSMYHLAKTAIHDPKQAASDLAQPYVDLAKHPVKTFLEHPGNTGMLLIGAKSAAGRGAGKALRVAPSKALRKVGSTERAAAVTENTALTEPRPYSKDVISKAGQVAKEKVQARHAVQPRMTDKQIARRVDETVAARRIVSAKHASETERAAKRAVGKRPTAANVLHAQAIVNGSVADLQALLGEWQHAAKGLKGDALKTNLRNQAAIRQALKSHDPAKVAEATARYTKLAQAQEKQLVDRGLIGAAEAENARLAPAAVRRLGAQTGAEPRRAVKASAKAERQQAASGARVAKQAAVSAESRFQRAYADARVSTSRSKSSPELKAAEKSRRQAVTKVARLRKQRNGTDRSLTYTAQIRTARAAARDAERAVSSARARVAGVAPREADALLKALAGRDETRTVLSGARAVRETARKQHVRVKRELKQGAQIGPNGEILDTAAMRAALNGNPEPAFISQEAAGVRGRSALPTSRPSLSVKGERTGEAVRSGTLRTDPKALVDQAVARQNVIDAADNYKAVIREIGYRESGKIKPFGTQKIAEARAAELKADTGREWSVMQAPERTVGKKNGQPVKRQEFVLVPKAAKDRLDAHQNIPQQHPLLKALGRNWRTNVLAFSPRWLAGNVVEAGLRSLVAQAGPRSYLTGRKVLREMERQNPAKADEFRARTVGGGNYAAADRLGEEAGQDLGRFANAARSFTEKPGGRQLAGLYSAYTNFVFKTLNGRVENQFQTAMLGKALRDHPLMEDKAVKLSQRAVEDAAKGLTNTNAQVELGRAVDRMYGQYDKFSPNLRSSIVTYTPFAAWSINAVRFLTRVLPQDHPVLMAVLVSADQASEEWRKNGEVPPILQTLTGYTPMSLLANSRGNPLSSLAGLLMPQYNEIQKNFGGDEWTGRKLTAGQDPVTFERAALAAVTTFVEGQVPAASQAARLAGVRLPNMADTTKIEPSVAKRAAKIANPLAPKGAGQQKVTPAKGGGSLPPGVSQRELDELVRDAQSQSNQPQVSQAEIDALLKSTR